MGNISKKLIFSIIFLSFPWISHGAWYQVPSGLWVDIPESNKIFKWFILPSGLRFFAEVHIAEAAELTLEERIKIYIISMAQKYGVDSELLLKIAKCESHFNPSARGDYRSETDTFMARGLFQFWAGTFSAFRKESGLLHLKYDSWESQAELAAWAFANGKEKHWLNCWRFASR